MQLDNGMLIFVLDYPIISGGKNDHARFFLALPDGGGLRSLALLDPAARELPVAG
jgi:hypothetical protein